MSSEYDQKTTKATVSRNMGFCVGCLDVTTCTTDDYPQFNYFRLSSGVEPKMKPSPTLVMHDCPLWDLDLPWRVNVAGRRLEEKERLFWDGITQFKCVFRIVPTNSHDLFTCTCERCHSYRERQKWKTDKGRP